MAVFTGSLLLDLLGILTAIVVTVYTYYKWSFQYWKRRNVPYLEPAGLFGNFTNPLTNPRSDGEQCMEFYRQVKARGLKYCGIYGMATPLVIINDLELLKHVLTKDFSHFTDRALYTNETDPLSCHLFALGGEKWKSLRVKLTPTFTSGKMKAMFQTVVDTALILERHLAENINDKMPVDIKDIVARFTTDVIGSCAFGLDCNSFIDPDSPFRVYGNKFLRPSTLHTVKIIFCMNFPNLSRTLGLAITQPDVSDFYMKIVKDTVSYRERTNVERKDFLQLLIDIKNNTERNEDGLKDDQRTLTMNEIAAQCFLFFLAGFDTSSVTMTFALFELATHPEIQNKVREEIVTVLAKHDNKITYDSLSELKYMKQVIDETLRKYPVLPMLSRLCVEDYKIPGEDVVIQKGVTVLIPVQGIHYDEDHYKNPKVFDPDRFSEENKNNRHHYAHLGFGEGPRICIGERFGVMQTKVGLTTILKQFNVRLSGKTQLPLKMSTNSIVATTEGEIWLDLERI